MKHGVSTAVILVVALSGAAQAQQPAPPSGATPALAFKQGGLYAGPRVWLGNLNGAVAVGGQVEKAMTPPGKYGSGIVSGGVGVDYYSWSNNYALLGKYSYSVIPIQAFSNYHFALGSNPKLDPYLGLSLVYSVVSASWDGPGAAASADGSSLGFAGQGACGTSYRTASRCRGRWGSATARWASARPGGSRS